MASDRKQLKEPRDPKPGAVERLQTEEADDPGNAITWVVDVPLLTNPVVLRALAFMLPGSWALGMLVFAIVMWGEGDFDLGMLGTAAGALSIGVAVVAVLILLVMLVFFRNRMRCRYVLDEDMVASIIIDRMAEIGGSLSVVAGTMSRNPTLLGSGMIASNSRVERTLWKHVAAADYLPHRHYIRLKSPRGWPVGAIFCSAESYPVVEARVRAIMARRAG